jgi:hypothetical protein
LTLSLGLAAKAKTGAFSMSLTFPTIAEQVLFEFNHSTKTVALITLARKRGAEVTRSYMTGNLIYTFDDDTSLIITGRGKNYKVRAQLP